MANNFCHTAQWLCHMIIVIWWKLCLSILQHLSSGTLVQSCKGLLLSHIILLFSLAFRKRQRCFKLIYSGLFSFLVLDFISKLWWNMFQYLHVTALIYELNSFEFIKLLSSNYSKEGGSIKKLSMKHLTVKGWVSLTLSVNVWVTVRIISSLLRSEGFHGSAIFKASSGFLAIENSSVSLHRKIQNSL